MKNQESTLDPVRATVLYSPAAYPYIDSWVLSIAKTLNGKLISLVLDGDRELAFDFDSAIAVGQFITAIESNPLCSVRIGCSLAA